MMSDGDDAQGSSLEAEMKAVLARLVHAREAQSRDKAEHLDDVGQHIQALARRIADLSPVERQGVRPLLLALLDEVERTIEVFQEGMAGMRQDLTSAHQSRTAGAAYRQRQKL